VPHWKNIYADWQKFPGTQAQEKEKSRAVRLKKSKGNSRQTEAAQIFTKNRKKLPELEKQQKKISTKITTELQKTDELLEKPQTPGKIFLYNKRKRTAMTIRNGKETNDAFIRWIRKKKKLLSAE
jgi:hypothetical protein